MSENKNITDIFTALAAGETSPVPEIMEKAKQRFDALPLEVRYQRLLDVHYLLAPTFSKKKVDKDLNVLTGSDDLQLKYDLLHSTLAGQTNEMGPYENLVAKLLEIEPVSREMFKQAVHEAAQILEETNKFVAENISRIEDRMRFHQISENARAEGVLFEGPVLKQ